MRKNGFLEGILIMILSACVSAEQRTVAGCIVDGMILPWSVLSMPISAEAAYVPLCAGKCEQQAWARYDWERDFTWGKRFDPVYRAAGVGDEINVSAYCGDTRIAAKPCTLSINTHWCTADDGYSYFTVIE